MNTSLFDSPTGDRDLLIEQYRSYARALAAEVIAALNVPAQVDADDLIACAELGLVEAAGRYDRRRGIAFTTFAYYRIRGAIYDGLRQTGWLSRTHYRRLRFAAHANDLRQLAAGDGDHHKCAGIDDEIVSARTALEMFLPVYLLSLDSTEDLPELADTGTPHSELVEGEELKNLTRALVSELAAEDRQILEDIYYRNVSMVEFGLRIGASKSWVSRLHARAVRRLRDLMRERGLLAEDNAETLSS